MNRSLTNVIRWAMDELVPPVIRDSRAFMWPFYCLAYRTVRPGPYMRFKSDVWRMTEDQYADFYRNLDSISRNRQTDNNEACLRRIVAECGDAFSVLDVGCGKGYVLDRIAAANAGARLVGVDLLDSVPDASFSYVQAPASRLPFGDGEFEVVVCTHVIEHLPSPEQVMKELVRVASGKVIVVTPRQRPYFHTLDEHINFFLYREELSRLVPEDCAAKLENLGGDWYMEISL